MRWSVMPSEARDDAGRSIGNRPSPALAIGVWPDRSAPTGRLALDYRDVTGRLFSELKDAPMPPAYIDEVKQPHRLTIPACIGCGAMRQDHGCPEACSECRLELVRADDYDQLTRAAAACRARILGLRPVVAELARTEPGPGEPKAAYQALQQSARSALRQAWRAPRRAVR